MTAVLIAAVALAAVVGILWPDEPPRGGLARRPPTPATVGDSANGRMVVVVGAAICLILAATVPAALPVVGALVLVDRRRRRRRTAAPPADDASLAELADQLALALAAGLTIPVAVVELAERGPPALRASFVDLVAEQAVGRPLPELLRRLDQRLGPDARSLGTALATALIEGGSTRPVLDRLADDARRRHRRRRERHLQELPVKLLVPVAVCGLPAVLLGAVVPLIVVSLGSIRP